MRRAVGAALVTFVVFVGGVVVGGHPIPTHINDLPSNVRGLVQGDTDDPVTAEVLGILRRGYYKDVSVDALRRASVDGLVASLKDPYTFYLDPGQYAELTRHTNGVYFGVGLRVSQRDDEVVVVGIFKDSPAAAADIRPGDVIVAVDGDAAGPLEAVVAKIRGAQGTTVRVTLRRGARLLAEQTLTRREVDVPVVSSRIIRGATPVGYVKLDGFTRGSAKALRGAVDRLILNGAKTLVFDLRGDPGGLVGEAIGVAGVFLPKGSSVVIIQGRAEPREERKTTKPPATDLPLVVLVDRNSASASEVVSGALRDNDRATIVGTRTFGKALVQTLVELRDGGALRYTIARYRTPDGIDINKKGLVPDQPARDLPDTPRDEALDRAVAVATGLV